MRQRLQQQQRSAAIQYTLYYQQQISNITDFHTKHATVNINLFRGYHTALGLDIRANMKTAM